ncbi:NADH:flavin oxidoreductase/NADH oxidase [Yoonia sediminilitoris]|uniref:2,4-dienoyl-CoA reductase-like NADH-dependent reductase (Old Yellow Enzyme family) n=1 Tax=Yoonia sediminilitoris TaxID=1286148 RepID=A0A2T6K986_9RHOB|nr:NADH:flavin oxidoreductase/NADH oxidase [Yoonia sediminilitoris]PUB11332.1 2,4-dienoyl-CoA reductase-like NADH-dependent reductase (Old Yellow Enzyme family) [Yoonia sediminilitoris]RCW91149.1 2,4-dienoyl-CoA reductase-like NADH-dependent reductase (Old Yellow Enzyme family) [Yoonia sediminilitoris]
MTAAPHLFQPLQLRSLETRNRVVISPMCQYSAHEGHMDEWHLVHLGRFAIGGAGIVFTEATAVQKCGRITHGCPGLWTDSQIPGHARVAQFALRNGAIPAIQLGHAGRKGGMQRPWFGNGPLNQEDIERGDMPWTPVGASALPIAEGWPVPHELSETEIGSLIDDYASAARRALAAGYKIAEIHGAHGYLIHSFLSPISNQRSDKYGGDLSGRMRLALEVAQRVRSTWPSELPLFFRTSAVDGPPEGWSLDDTVVLAQELKQIGVDVIDCSSGGISGAATASSGQKRQPGFQVGYAERVRREANITTVAVGLITHPEQAEDILAKGQADLVALGREALVDPMWALHAAQTLGHDTLFETWPQQSGWWLAGRQQTSDFYQPK